jgi:hypothetical protein
MNRDEIAAKIIKGASIHRVAERIILETKPNTEFFKPIAAAKLAFLYRIDFGDACAIVSEMDLTPPQTWGMLRP